MTLSDAVERSLLEKGVSDNQQRMSERTRPSFLSWQLFAFAKATIGCVQGAPESIASVALIAAPRSTFKLIPQKRLFEVIFLDDKEHLQN